VPLILLLVLLPLVMIGLTPWLLLQRYRAGSARRPARKWMVLLTIVSTMVSAVFLLVGAAFTNIWVPWAFGDGALGLASGCILGVIGLALTRWEATVRTFHYTPSRALVLFVTLIITARVLFGIYRTIVAAQSGISGHQLIGAFGVAESLGAGALVLGYYVAYNAGVLWKIRRWERRPLRPA
jgi:hypothetical protein